MRDNDKRSRAPSDRIVIDFVMFHAHTPSKYIQALIINNQSRRLMGSSKYHVFGFMSRLYQIQ